MTATASGPVALVLSRLEGVRGNGHGWMARCPAHDDRKGSLSIGEGVDGEALVYCHAGCGTEKVINKIDLRMSDLFSHDNRKPAQAAASRTPGKITRYEVKDAAGTRTFYHVREDRPGYDKDVWWEQTDGTRGLRGKIKLSEMGLYGVEALATAAADVPAFLVEGEKAADALIGNGILAVGTVTGASGTPGDDALRPLLGRSVFLWPDNDDAGRQHMQRIGQAFLRLGHRDVRTIDWQGAPEKGDAADLVSLEGWRDDFDALLDQARKIEGPKSLFASLSALLSNPIRPRWLVKGLIETPSTGSFFGASGSGKTFVALDFAMSAAVRMPWMGKDIVADGPVFYIANEGFAGLPRRGAAWQLHHKITIPENRLFVSSTRASLDEAGGIKVALEIEQIMKDFGAAAPSLLVVDTLARSLPAGADESATKDMTAFINVVDSIRDRFGCVAVIVHHTGYEEKRRSRGSSSFPAALDFELCISKKDGVRIGEWSKLRDLPDEPRPQEFILRPVTVDATEDGELISSAVVEWKGTPAVDPRPKLTPMDELGLRTLRDAIGCGLSASLEAWRPLFYAGHSGDGADAKQKAFRRVRDNLITKGIVRVENDIYSINPTGYGTPSCSRT